MNHREKKKIEYENKYKDIPREYLDRLNWMCDKYKITENKMNEILHKRDQMLTNLEYKEFNVILFEEPEGAKRPRFRIVNRYNLINEAINNGNFVHVYSPNASADNQYMKRLIGDDLVELNEIIYTPCIVEFNAYFKTPAQYNIVDTFLAELSIERPITKPDWDNIGKKYSDMYNHNVWIDDNLTITGIVNKYYSILPRVEIKLKYLNMLYNKYQYNSMKNKLDIPIQYFGGINNDK